MINKANRFVLTLFLILLIFFPTYWLVRGRTSAQVSYVEGRVLGLPESSFPTLKIALEYLQQGKPELAIALVWDLYTGGSLQNKFDGAVTDQFPFRMPLIKFAKFIDRKIIDLTYIFTKDNAIPADMTSDIYIISGQDALILPPGTIDKNGYKKIDERLRNYELISSIYPEINFYIYYLETLPFSPYHPLNKFFFNADQGKAFAYFQANLPDQIELGKMTLDGLSDHLLNYYRTDHHWNTNGILEAYDGIYQLLSSNYDNIPQKLIPSAMIEFPEVEFLGSLARKTLYPVKADALIGFRADFPDCITTDQGIEGVYDHREDYLNGNIPTIPYFDHYGAYFGSQSGLLEYTCETNTDRNILVIGDSYARPLISLIATQYEHTYFIDLRQSPDFALSTFLSNNHVDDILVVSDYQVVFLDTELWTIKP